MMFGLLFLGLGRGESYFCSQQDKQIRDRHLQNDVNHLLLIFNPHLNTFSSYYFATSYEIDDVLVGRCRP